MTKCGFFRTTLGGAVLALAAATATAAIERGSVEGHVHYAMGGIGLDERDQLMAQRGDYNLWVSTATRSGNYLANVELRIIDRASGRSVLQGTMSGPWLFADVAPGSYTVHATAPNGRTLTRNVQVGDQGLRKTVLHFDVDAGIGADTGERTAGADLRR